MSRIHAEQAPRFARERRAIAATLPQPCVRCGHDVNREDRWDVDHVPALALDPDAPAYPAHATCNRSAGATLGNRMRGMRKGKPVDGFYDSAPVSRTSHLARSGEVPRPTRRNGLVRPRVETGGRATGRDLGDDVAGVARDVLGFDLTPWQRYAAGRATELTARGELRWPTVVVTVARGAGKSWLIQALMTWRLLQSERFGEPQELVSVAQTQGVARLSWERPARRLIESGVVSRATWGRGLESVQLTSDGSIWRVLAARLSATTGYRASMVAVDEAWSVPRDVVEQGLVPQTRRRRQPQILIVSTAGDGRSDLLVRYRDRALAGDQVLLLEWSADPTWPADDRQAWRWANPDFDADTERQLAALQRSTPEGRFRSQYLNQWVNAVDGWLPPSAWSGSRQPDVAGAGAGVVAVDCSPDGSGWGAVHADTAADGRIVLRAHYATHAEQLWPWVSRRTGARVLLGATVDGLQPDGVTRSGTFGAREVREWLPGVRQALTSARIVHDGHAMLTEHVLRARTVHTQGGLVLKTGGDPHELCRVMIAAVGASMRGRAPTLV